MSPVVHCNKMDCKSCVKKISLWNKKLNDFIPIIPVHNMSGYKESYLNPEQRNMKRMNVRVAYHPIVKILEAKNNGTEITGALGEVWNLVGSYLNLTTSVTSVIEYYNDAVPRGPTELVIVPLMESNQLDIAIPSEYSQNFTNDLEYLSLTSLCYRLYVPPSFESDDKWIFKLVTYDVLLVIWTIMFFMSILNFFIDKYTARYNSNSGPISLCDYFFQTFATFTNQGSLPQIYQGNWSRIMTLTRSVLAFLFLTMSTAYLFSLMSKKSMHTAFTDIPSFLAISNMKLIIRSTSPGWMGSLAGVSPTVKSKRVEIVDTIQEMYLGRCGNTTLWQNDFLQRTVGYMYECHLAPATSCLMRSHVFLAISRKFHYKRSLLVGIIKIHESGLINNVEERWLSPPISFADDKYQSVTWEEVRTIFFIFLVGVMMSVIFLVIEKIVVIHKHYRLREELNQQRRRIDRRLKRKAIC